MTQIQENKMFKQSEIKSYNLKKEYSTLERMKIQPASPNITPITDMERYELHVMVGDTKDNISAYSLVEQMEFTKVDISGKHKRLCDGELFSKYSNDRNYADTAFVKFRSFMTQNEHIPLLLEEEIVAHQVMVAPNPNFSAKAWEKLAKYLKEYGTLPEKNCSRKQADIHVSLPLHSLSHELEKKLSENEVTFLKVKRHGSETIPGGCEEGEEWISFTMQFAGHYGAHNAAAFYKIFTKLLPEIGGYDHSAIIKLEIISDFYVTKAHAGIPAIGSSKILMS